MFVELAREDGLEEHVNGVLEGRKNLSWLALGRSSLLSLIHSVSDGGGLILWDQREVVGL